MKKSGPPTPLPTAEYEAIEQAMMETSRGRWFLTEFAERNRRKDTQVLLDAISQLEVSVKQPGGFGNIEKIQSDLLEMSQAIQRARSEISSLKLPEDDNSQLIGATEELDAIVTSTEKATHNILQAAEDIQETVWTLREQGVSEAPCARIDTRITDIYTSCSFQDITGQRTHKVVNVLRYLEARINAMISIWGISPDDFVQQDQPAIKNERPDSHLLNGPPGLHEEGLEQDDVDHVLLQMQKEIEAQDPSEHEIEDAPSLLISETAQEIETAAQQLETLSEQTIDIARNLSEDHHDSLLENHEAQHIIDEPVVLDDTQSDEASSIETLSEIDADNDSSDLIDTQASSSLTEEEPQNIEASDLDSSSDDLQDTSSTKVSEKLEKLESLLNKVQQEEAGQSDIQSETDAATDIEALASDNETLIATTDSSDDESLEVVSQEQEQEIENELEQDAPQTASSDKTAVDKKKDDPTNSMIEEANRLTDNLRDAVLDIENLTQAATDQDYQKLLERGVLPQQDEPDDADPNNFANNIAQHLNDTNLDDDNGAVDDSEDYSPPSDLEASSLRTEAVSSELNVPLSYFGMQEEPDRLEAQDSTSIEHVSLSRSESIERLIMASEKDSLLDEMPDLPKIDNNTPPLDRLSDAPLSETDNAQSNRALETSDEIALDHADAIETGEQKEPDAPLSSHTELETNIDQLALTDDPVLDELPPLPDEMTRSDDGLAEAGSQETEDSPSLPLSNGSLMEEPIADALSSDMHDNDTVTEQSDANLSQNGVSGHSEEGITSAADFKQPEPHSIKSLNKTSKTVLFD